MAKDKTKKKAESKEETTSAKDEDDSGSEPVELEAVKDKKGEPDDNLKRRAEWFQKRTGG